MKAARRDGLSILGVGAAACVACCAGPLLAFLGGLGIAGLASTLLIGSLGLVVVAAAVVGFLVARRRRTTTCEAPPQAPVGVAAPSRRTRS